MLKPFTLQSYEGVAPPLVGVAVNVFEALAQEGLLPEVIAIETKGVTAELMVMVIPFDVAGLPVTPDRLDVIIHVTACPLVMLEVVKVDEFVPAFTPATCH